MAILFALAANTVFAFAATLFAQFSREVSGKWINCFKLSVAFFCFGLTSLLLRDGMDWSTAPFYIASGALGLFAADHFLCEAFSKIGSARTVMLFSFSPLFIAAWSYIFFGETLSTPKLIAILFLMGCVFVLSFEKFREEGRWELTGLLMAFVGILLDGLGNIVTSYAFHKAPNNGVMSVCALRSLGAFLAFILLSPFLKVHLVSTFKKLSPSRKRWALGASVMGTFLSLTLWISAVKRGNLTSLVAISGSTPLLATLFESIHLKKAPTPYLYVALGFFALGFYFLTLY